MCNLILIAAPDESSRSAYRLFLESCGYEVETAAGGLECLTKLCRRRPNVLVLDRGLLWGGADGVLACVREEWNGSMVPVVLLSDEHSAEDPSLLVKTPVVACLRKPVQKNAVLLTTLMNHFSPLECSVS